MDAPLPTIRLIVDAHCTAVRDCDETSLNSWQPEPFFLDQLAVGPALAEIAARAGYDFVSLRLREVTPSDAFPMVDDPSLVAQTQAALRDGGIGVLDVELAHLTPDADVQHDFGPMVETAATLGAKTVLCQAHDENRSRLIDHFRALRHLATSFGLRLDMEFLTWTAMRSPADVLRLFAESADSQSGVCIDTLHFFRSGGQASDIADIPKERLFMAQLSDAAGPSPQDREELVRVARCDRRMPGDGDLDLGGAIAAFPAETIFSIEVPNVVDAKRFPPATRAAMMLDKARQLEGVRA